MILIFLLCKAYAQLLINVQFYQKDLYKDLSMDLSQVNLGFGDQLVAELDILSNDFSQQMPVLMQGKYDYLDTNRLADLLQGDQSDCRMDKGSILGGHPVQTLTFRVGVVLPLRIQDAYNVYPIAQGAMSLNLGVMLANDNIPSFTSMQLKVTKLKANQCYNQCSGNGRCVQGFCQCHDAWIGKYCDQQGEVSPIPYKVDMMIQSHQARTFLVSLKDLDLSHEEAYFEVTTLKQSSGYEVIYVQVKCSFPSSYSDLNSISQELFLHDLHDFTVTQDYSSTVIFPLDQIRSCIQNASDASQFTQTRVKPYMQITLYNPLYSQLLAGLSVNYQAFDATQPSLQIVYIVTISLSGAIMVLIIVVWMKNKRNAARRHQVPIQQITNQQQNDRQKRIEDLNKAAYERYMPPKEYKDVVIEFQELKEIPECMVCLETWKSDDKTRLTPCFHLFHSYCLDQWLQRHQNCPFCRAQLSRRTLKEAADILSNSLQEISVSGRQSFSNDYITRIRRNSLSQQKIRQRSARTSARRRTCEYRQPRSISTRQIFSSESLQQPLDPQNNNNTRRQDTDTSIEIINEQPPPPTNLEPIEELDSGSRRPSPQQHVQMQSNDHIIEN